MKHLQKPLSTKPQLALALCQAMRIAWRSRFVVAIIYLLSLHSVSRADTQNCGNLSASYCGGIDGTAAESRCYPEFHQISAYIVEVESLSVSIKRLHLLVSYSARGYQSVPTAPFQAQVFAKVDNSAHELVEGYYSTNIIPTEYATCVNLNRCVSYSVIVADNSTWVKFWGLACQTFVEGGCACNCQTDTVYLDAQGAAGELAGENFRPLRAELGPIGCESQVGDPLNVTNGNMFINRLDCVVPSDRGPRLEFARYYNSSGQGADSLLVSAWRTSFDYKLSQDTVSSRFKLTECTGREIAITKQELVQDTITKVTYTFPYGVPYRFSSDTLGNYVVTLKDGSRLIFDGLGFVDSIQDLAGNQVQIFRTGSLADSIRNASGRTLHLKYATGNLARIESSLGDTIVSYEYDNDESVLRRVTYEDDSWEEYEYDSTFHQITKVLTSDDIPTYYSYDTAGVAIAFNRASGAERVDLAWTVPFTRGCLSEPPDTIICAANFQSGALMSTYFSIWAPDFSRRLVVRRENPDCAECATEYQYDANGYSEQVTNPNGSIDTYKFDARGNMIESLRGAQTADSQLVLIDYDRTFNKPTMLRYPSVGNPSSEMDAVEITYNSAGCPIEISESGWVDTTHEYADVTQLEYNAAGQLVKYDGPRTDAPDTVKVVYYANGDLHMTILANADTTRYGERDELGRMTFVVSSSGDTTRLHFDARGNVLQVVYLAGTADSAVYAYGYNRKNELTFTTLPQGGIYRLEYDSTSYLAKVVDPIGSYASFAYDNFGNRVQSRFYSSADALRLDQAFGLNARHQLLTSAGPYDDTTRYAYSAAGELDTIINALGTETVLRHDTHGRVTSSVSPLTADSTKISYTYDSRNNVTKVIDPDGNAYVFRYDGKGRLTVDSCAATGKTQYGYNPDDYLIWRKNAAGDSIAYQYDAVNRLTAVIFPDSQNEHYLYDGTQFSYGKGRLYKDSTASVRTTYRYDAKGRLYQEIRKFPSDTANYTTSYAYDKNDNLISLTYPSGNIVAYDYDSTDNVIRVRGYFDSQWDTLASDIEYAPFGGAERWHLGNGINMSYSHDLRYQVDAISTDTINIVDWLYTYDAVGNVTEIENLVDALKTRQFTYDELSRLIRARSPDFPDTSLSFGYARNGNRDTLIAVASTSDTTVYGYSNNKLASLTGGTAAVFTYDALGNIVKDKRGSDSTLFVYNDDGRLTSITHGATTTSFGYDAQRRRVTRTVSSNTTKFINNATGQVLVERLHDGSRNEYVYLNGKLLAKLVWIQQEGGDPGGGEDSAPGGGGELDSPPATIVYYFHNDHLGTPWFITNKNQVVSWAADYYPFGEVYDELASTLNPHRFPGQLDDPTTDFSYNWHRYYSPELGRYYQADPIGFGSGDINQYRYAASVPTMLTDPDGRVVPVVVAVAYLLYEVGSSVADAWTTYNALRDPCATWEEKSLLTTAFVAGIFAPGGGYASGGKALLRGQTHHAISKRVFEALETHSSLGRIFKYRDSRFTTRAIDRSSHMGYQSWHRNLDQEVTNWLERNPEATKSEFVSYLRRRYDQSDLRQRFPQGL